jgi:hypothetical protein
MPREPPQQQGDVRRVCRGKCCVADRCQGLVWIRDETRSDVVT